MAQPGRDSDSDAALWLEATHGGSSAFAAIFDRHRVRVFRKAYRSIQNAADAEDVVAMVFLEAWKKRDDVRFVDGSVLPWLLAMTGYVTLNVERSKRRHGIALSKLPLDEAERDWSEDVSEDLDRAHQWAQVRTAIARLGERDQVMLQLAIVDDLSTQEVAAALDIPVGTVKSRLSRARTRLREEFDKAGIASDFDAAGGDQ
ncbi:sigma-70 family RNA polymerase sigma factor [Gryllotalpicola sp.]|uniref:RNA polymerase sigma factor n=1 Tax=Gryllotalpicola sp. TaxID=1932787 RepID=UPI00260291BB|nr:sigma-70 family RNA polymerase sigma factor [Gryllotalpicola sp.]